MKKDDLIKQNEESFDMNIIEMPEQLDELSMNNIKGGFGIKIECAGKSNCNIHIEI